MSEKENKVKIDKPKIKRRYILDVEAIAPVRLQLETWAFSDEEALEQLNNPRLVNLRQRPDIDLARINKKKVSVKDAITSLVKIVKNF